MFFILVAGVGVFGGVVLGVDGLGGPSYRGLVLNRGEFRDGLVEMPVDEKRSLLVGERPAEGPLGELVQKLADLVAAVVIALGEWSQERHSALQRELEEHVAACWKEAVKYGTLTEGPRLDPDLMFEDVFKEMPEHLQRQREQLRAERG